MKKRTSKLNELLTNSQEILDDTQTEIKINEKINITKSKIQNLINNPYHKLREKSDKERKAFNKWLSPSLENKRRGFGRDYMGNADLDYIWWKI